jgi:DNA adenine methylase
MYQPIIPWIGGKRRLAKTILPMFPIHTCYAEPFAGGAALFFLKDPSEVEVLNDINLELVTLYRVGQHHLEEFCRQFKWALASRKLYEWGLMTNPETLTDIQRAARFYYLQKLAFGGKVHGQTFGTATTCPPRLNLLRLEEDLSQAHLRLSRVCIEHLTWQRCIEKYDRAHTLFYYDPPYWGTEGYGVEFGLNNYDELARLARTIKGKMIISVNDIDEMREAFKGLETKSTGIKYTVGGADKTVSKTELIICNW